MTKVNQKNEYETKSDISPCEIFKSDVISFLSKNIKVLQYLSKSSFLRFMTRVNPNNGNETKSDIFPRNIFKSNTIFRWSQNTKKSMTVTLASFNLVAKKSTNK